MLSHREPHGARPAGSGAFRLVPKRADRKRNTEIPSYERPSTPGLVAQPAVTVESARAEATGDGSLDEQAVAKPKDAARGGAGVGTPSRTCRKVAGCRSWRSSS